jgi:hypothetical protein
VQTKAGNWDVGVGEAAGDADGDATGVGDALGDALGELGAAGSVEVGRRWLFATTSTLISSTAITAAATAAIQ